MLILNKNILTIGGNRLEGGPLTPPTPPGPTFDEVTIGTQTWMAKNLAIDDGGEGIDIKDNVTANGVNFGTQYYYNRAAAIRLANSISGWHLPSEAEWETLATYLGGLNIAGNKLKSTSGWDMYKNGTDDYGFTVLPLGTVYDGNSWAVGSYAYFQTSEMDGNNYYRDIVLATSSNLILSSYQYDDSLSVRLVKDT